MKNEKNGVTPLFMQQQQKDTEKNYTFPQKAWIVGGILALITVILLL
ncbi:MAG: hypothetical protein ICV51_11395, partial [Flavisolibacter sp.]|nr:hypothetical protein [Flavisolibacter sp.]